ncbi:MAG: molecular chaperone DnaJ [Rhodospirillales bacterium]|nr:molecular chaperone DnaJ [Rhodospirillales bacterium]
MYPFLLLGIAVLVGFMLFARWYATADPKDALTALKWIATSLFVLIAGFFIVTGRLAWAFMAIPVLLPWLMRARAVARTAKAFSRMSQARAGAPSGETSEVETRFLKMTLDHDSGDMDGAVQEGLYQGKNLTSLTTAQLVGLLRDWQTTDLDSARVLEAYLDRHRPDWHDHQGEADGAAPQPQKTAMGRSEALQVLGLAEGATPAEIKSAHRKLISGMHPDHGGSDYLAAQINQAKDILLGD